MGLVLASDLTDTATLYAYSTGAKDTSGHPASSYADGVEISCRVDVYDEGGAGSRSYTGGKHTALDAMLFAMPTETIALNDRIVHNGTQYTVTNVNALCGWDGDTDHLEVSLVK